MATRRKRAPKKNDAVRADDSGDLLVSPDLQIDVDDGGAQGLAARHTEVMKAIKSVDKRVSRTELAIKKHVTATHEDAKSLFNNINDRLLDIRRVADEVIATVRAHLRSTVINDIIKPFKAHRRLVLTVLLVSVSVALAFLIF